MLTIRKATRRDVDDVWAIRNAAICNQCVDYYPADILKTWARSEISELFTNIVEQHFYLAVYINLTVGTGMINTDTGKIDAIFVHPNHMRKGVGRKMIKFLEDIALQNRLQLITLESTLNAVVFYRKCGFKGDDICTYVSPSGVSLDCIPMTKAIG